MMPTVYKYIAVILALAALFYYVHHDGYTEGKRDVQQEWDAQTAVNANVITKALTDNATLTTTLETQHAKSETAIATLHAAIASTRVLLPTAPAATVCADKAPSPSGSIPAATSGELLPATPTSTQTDLDVFMAGVDADLKEADLVVSQCKVLQGWAVGVSK